MESHWSVFYPEKYSNPETDSDETLYMRIRRVCEANPTRIALEYFNNKITYAAFQLTPGIISTSFVVVRIGEVSHVAVLLIETDASVDESVTVHFS